MLCAASRALPACCNALQLTALTRLHSLKTERMRQSGAVLATLSSSLRRLAISYCVHLPACLSQLRGLEALSILGCDMEWEVLEDGNGHLVPALGLLTSLTHLALGHFAAPGSESALTNLTRLRSLWWLPFVLSRGVALPAGSWNSSLQLLALPIDLLHNSLAALGGARQLQTLAIDAHNTSLLPRVVRWAAQRPALEGCVAQVPDEDLSEQFDVWMEVQRSAPRLCIQRHPDLTEHPLFCAVG